jgi:hypothetical protein
MKSLAEDQCDKDRKALHIGDILVNNTGVERRRANSPRISMVFGGQNPVFYPGNM